MNRSSTFSSNSVRLSWKEWLVLVAILGVMLAIIPRAWVAFETFSPSPDYRLPYQLSDDYWLFERWSRFAGSSSPGLIIGDSVVWGQYVTGEQTLSHYLNETLRGGTYANMGVDGLHPAAMLGLVENFGGGISEKAVILHLNPLWMSSKRHDLSGDEEFRFNHPGLVPQFSPDLACYRPSLDQRIGAVLARSVSFFSWAQHVRSVYFDNMDLPNWTMENPETNPLSAVTFVVPLPENRPKSRPVPWTTRGMKTQDFPWVEPDSSFQWASFRKVIDTLRARGNTVFVLIGPFNPFVLTEESRRRYRGLLGSIEGWLKENQVGYHTASDLPSELYADASHPLDAGYSRMAAELCSARSFQVWHEKIKGGKE